MIHIYSIVYIYIYIYIYIYRYIYIATSTSYYPSYNSGNDAEKIAITKTKVGP